MDFFVADSSNEFRHNIYLVEGVNRQGELCFLEENIDTSVIIESNFCTNCGFENKKKFKFCVSCGNVL